MKRQQFSTEQIVNKLRQAEVLLLPVQNDLRTNNFRGGETIRFESHVSILKSQL